MQIANRYRKLVSYLPYDTEIDYIAWNPSTELQSRAVWKSDIKINDNNYVIECIGSISNIQTGSNLANLFLAYLDEQTEATRIIVHKNNLSNIYAGYKRQASQQNLITPSGFSFANKNKFRLEYKKLTVTLPNGTQSVNTLLAPSSPGDVGYLRSTYSTAKYRKTYYGLKVWHNSELIIDWIPVRKGNTGYFYDKVTKKLINVLQTNIELGPDKKTAKDYIQDGLIAMYDGIENAGWKVHNKNATTWKNLVGGDIPDFNDITGKITFADNYAYILPNTETQYVEHPIPTTTWQQEMVINMAGMSNTDMYRPYIGANRIILTRNYYNTIQQVTLATADGNYNPAGWTINQVIDATMSITVPANANGSTMQAYRNGTRLSLSRTYQGTRPIPRRITFMPNTNGDFKIYSYRLYNRTLTQAEMTHNYNIDKSRFNIL